MTTIADLIARSAAQNGISPEAMVRIGQLESGLNPRAQNPNSSAGGLFQFIDSTWNSYGGGDKYDPATNAANAGKYLADVSGHLSRSLGRAPEPWELYLGHQQGAGGASKLLGNPQALAASLVGRDAIRLNGGNPDTMTAADFANLWRSKYNGASVPAGAGSTMAYNGPGAQAGGLADMFGSNPAKPMAPFANILQQQKDRKEEEEAERQAELARLSALFAPMA